MTGTVRIDGREVGRVTGWQMTTSDGRMIGNRVRLDPVVLVRRKFVASATLTGTVNLEALRFAGNRAARRKARAEWRKAERSKR